MYFPDLSAYSYGLRAPLANVLNVGWLDRSQPFPRGVVSPSISERLKNWFEVGRVKQMRGIHECNLCPVQQWPLIPLWDNPSITIDAHIHLLGHWEIWLPGPNGKIFASPGLIIHYIDKHEYSPPNEYIDAVMSEEKRLSWDANAEYALRATPTTQ